MSSTRRPERPEDVRVDQHMGLANIIARRYRSDSTAAGLDLDDLMQEAAVAMLRARETWNPELGSWGHYAGLWITQSTRRYAQNHGSGVRIPVYLQQRRGKAGEPARATVHSLNLPGHNHDGVECGELIDLLTYPEREDAPYLPSLEEQIGAELGVTRERARQIEARAMLRIREQLVRDGELERVDVPRYVATQRAAIAQRERERQRQRDTRASRKPQGARGRAA